MSKEFKNGPTVEGSLTTFVIEHGVLKDGDCGVQQMERKSYGTCKTFYILILYDQDEFWKHSSLRSVSKIHFDHTRSKSSITR
jgi:hypothetical protein